MTETSQKMRRRLRRRSGALAALLVIALLPAAIAGARPASSAAFYGYQPAAGVPQRMNLTFCLGEQICEVGDVNGDGRDDLVAFARATLGGRRAGDVWVARSRGSWFEPAERWASDFCKGNAECYLGNVDGDRPKRRGRDTRADLIAFVKDTRGPDRLGQVMIARSNGHGFDQLQIAQYQEKDTYHTMTFCIGNEVCRVGDIDGDGKVDLVAFGRDANPDRRGYVWFARSTMEPTDARAIFEKPKVIKTAFCTGEEECAVGNVDGWHGDDLIAFARETGDDPPHSVLVYLTDDLSKADAGDPAIWHDAFCYANDQCLVGDVNGVVGETKHVDLVAFGSFERDGKTIPKLDLALAGQYEFSADVLGYEGDFCPGNDVCRLGDIDGNGQTDVVAFDRAADKTRCFSNVTVTFMHPAGAPQMPRMYLPMTAGYSIESCSQ